MKPDHEIAPKRREPIIQRRGLVPEELSPHDIVKRYIKAFIMNSTVKREDQQDATIRCLLLTSVSTCFGHHYSHPCTMCSHPTRQRPTTATNHIQQIQNNTPNAVTGPLIS